MPKKNRANKKKKTQKKKFKNIKKETKIHVNNIKYEPLKDIKDNNIVTNIEEEELNIINKEIQFIVKEQNKEININNLDKISDIKSNQDLDKENEELLDEKNINDIKLEFMDSKENQYFISNKGHKINPDLNEYTSLIGSLNNTIGDF